MMDLETLVEFLRRQVRENNSIAHGYTLGLIKELDERLTNGEKPPEQWMPKCEFCRKERIEEYMCTQCHP